MLDKLQKMYNELIEMLENPDLSYWQKENLYNAKNSIKLLIAIGED